MAISICAIFAPNFSHDGLITCVTVDDRSGEVLMLAHMNKEALDKTLSSGIMHYWSRSRGALWRKGDTSGQIQNLVELRVDCDQDALLVRAELAGGAVCHEGYRSCFFRQIGRDGVATVVTERVLSPEELYGKGKK